MVAPDVLIRTPQFGARQTVRLWTTPICIDYVNNTTGTAQIDINWQIVFANDVISVCNVNKFVLVNAWFKNYRQSSNIRRTKSQNLIVFSSRLAVVFVLFIEGGC